MPNELEVATEREGRACWVFQIRPKGQSAPDWEVTLAWADYDWWSPTGRHTPSEVALAVMHVLEDASKIEIESSAGPRRFDASNIRRLVPGADRLIVGRLQLAR